MTKIQTSAAVETCGLCGQQRVRGSLLRVSGPDEAEAIWVCEDCQHKLTLRIDNEGVKGG